MSFDWPTFDRNACPDSNYHALLRVLGLVSGEENLADQIHAAEAALKKALPSYQVNGEVVEVDSGKYKTAAFVYALVQAKGTSQFTLTRNDLARLMDYWTEPIPDAADSRQEKDVLAVTICRRGITTKLAVKLAKKAK
jgi:hypothetical protein